MKSRAIALGASVIALMLTSGGQAVAGGIEDLGQNLKVQTETSVSGPAGSSAEVEGNVKVPVRVPSKDSLEDVTRLPGRPSATVEAEQKRGKNRSEVVLDLDRQGVSAYVDQRRKGEFELEAEGQAGPRNAESTVTGYARRAGKARADSRAHSPKVKHAGIERSIRKHSRQASRKAGRAEGLRTRGDHDKPLSPLQAIGREVSNNPIQLSLAGWLIALTAVGGLAASRLVRRLQRTS